jgi:hypothetical protein
MTAIWTPAVDPWATDPATWPPVITRVYRGNPDYVTRMMQWEAQRFQQVGYAITSQSHVAGEWGCGPFLAAAILILALGIGLLVLVYLVAVKPDGTLTVVYQRR